MGRKSKADKELEKKLNEALRDLPKHMNEHLRAEESAKEDKYREERANLNVAVPTEIPCVKCGEPIVEYKTNEFVDHGSPRVIGPGGKGQYRISKEYYCGNKYCYLVYKFLPLPRT